MPPTYEQPQQPSTVPHFPLYLGDRRLQAGPFLIVCARVELGAELPQVGRLRRSGVDEARHATSMLQSVPREEAATLALFAGVVQG